MGTSDVGRRLTLHPQFIPTPDVPTLSIGRANPIIRKRQPASCDTSLPISTHASRRISPSLASTFARFLHCRCSVLHFLVSRALVTNPLIRLLARLRGHLCGRCLVQRQKSDVWNRSQHRSTVRGPSGREPIPVTHPFETSGLNGRRSCSGESMPGSGRLRGISRPNMRSFLMLCLQWANGRTRLR